MLAGVLILLCMGTGSPHRYTYLFIRLPKKIRKRCMVPLVAERHARSLAYSIQTDWKASHSNSRNHRYGCLSTALQPLRSSQIATASDLKAETISYDTRNSIHVPSYSDFHMILSNEYIYLARKPVESPSKVDVYVGISTQIDDDLFHRFMTIYFHRG